MTKEILIKRLKAKDSSRKRQLFAFYGTLISSFENASIIVDEIHSDLGEENLITVYDIYYCRRHFAKQIKWKGDNISKKNELCNSNSFQKKSSDFENLTWTDPATIKRNTLRSRFAPPENDTR